MERLADLQTINLPITSTIEPIPLAADSPFVVQRENGTENPQKLADLPEFQRKLNADQSLALKILDSNLMERLTFDQKRSMLIFYGWQTTIEDEIVERPFGVGELEKRRIIDEVLDNLEARYERLSGIMNIAKAPRTQGGGILLSEFDYWVRETLLDLPQLEGDLVEHLPSEFKRVETDRSQLQAKINESIERIKRQGLLRRKPQKKEDDKKEGKKERLAKPKTREQIMKEVFEKTGRVPVINGFDMWVYQNWLLNGEHPKKLAQKVPEGLGLQNYSKKQITSKIHTTTLKLKKYGVIDSDFNERRIKIRREKIMNMYESNGKLPTLEMLAKMLGVSRDLVADDFAYLQSIGKLPIFKRSMSEAQVQEMGEAVKSAISQLEVSGRQYAKGEISVAEISQKLRTSESTVHSFIRYHGESIGLPQRPNRKKLLDDEARQRRAKVEKVIRANLDKPVSEIFGIIEANDTLRGYKYGYVKMLRREILRQINAGNNLIN